ncbi:hypothetical protein [Geomicrobium sp. JCM 19039]|uniref:hypothetical protein n=1 Tax=Geomicrobium sp. JCM 19039 TaxID=1460636 RepID=UPI0005A63975|nr:hypothetical protein [Geomicrobium sp. JCM 19039]
MFVLLGMMPIILVGAFWNADLTNQTFLVLPVLGVFTIFLGGVLAVLSAKWMKMSREQTGSMFVTGAFLNLGSFGGLFVVFFIGLEALPFVALFRLFEELVYYTICYPIARKFGAQRTEDSQPRWKRILKDPFIMVIFSAICVGALLNVSSIPYATVYDQVNELFVPLTVIFLLIPVGFSMRIGAVGENSKAVTVIITIKHLIVPVTVTGVAYLLGLGAYADGMLLKVILILSACRQLSQRLFHPSCLGWMKTWQTRTGL